MKIACHQLGGIFAMVLACEACLDLPPIRYETEEAIIGLDFDVPLCQDDLDRIDRHIAFVEDMLDAASDEKIEIYIYASSPPRCPGLEGNSCYDTRRKIIRTHGTMLEHEIVHAVVDRFAEPPPFWNEGIAVALDGNGSHPGVATVMQSIHVEDAADLDYATAGHFIRWLLEEHDPALIRPILEGAAFEPTYDLPFPEAAALFEQEHPYAYPRWFPCDYPPLPQDEVGGGWHETVEIACDVPGGSTDEGGPFSVVRTVELTPGSYEIETHGGLGTRLVGCHTDVLMDEPPPNFHGDIPNEVETHPGVLFESGSLQEFEITEPGLFKVVAMARDEHETVEIELRAR